MTNTTSLEQYYLDTSEVGDFEAFINLIKKETKTFKSNELLRKCLNNACEGGHKKIVVAILKYREITNYPLQIFGINWGCYGYYALYYAFKGGNIDIINMIAWRTFSYTRHQLSKEYIWRYGLMGACESNRINIFETYVNKVSCTSDFINDCFQNACLSDNNIDMINYLITKGATLWDGGLLYACRGGCIQNVKLMIKHGASDWDNGMYEACFAGHAEITELMIDCGAKFTTKNIYHACRHGLIKIIKCMYTMCVGICYGTCLFEACKNNQMEVVNFLLPRISTYYYNHGLEGACAGGHLNIAELMIQKGAANLESSLYAACVHDQIDAVKFMIAAGASDPHGRCLRTRGFCNNIDVLKALTIRETMDWDEGLLAVCHSGNIKTVKYILENYPNKPIPITKLNRALDKARNHVNGVDIVNLLLQNGADNLKLLKGFTDFKLYCRYLNCLNIIPNKNNGNYLKYLKQFPPYILFIGCRLTKLNKNCCIKKLPVELFKLLSEY